MYFAEANITSANEDVWIAAVESVLFENRRARRNLESADVAQIVTGSDTVTIFVRNPVAVKTIENKVSSDSGFCFAVNAVPYCGAIVGAVESTAAEPGKSSGATTMPVAVIVGVVAVALLVVGAIVVFGIRQQSSDAATPSTLSERSPFEWDDNDLLSGSGTPASQGESYRSNTPDVSAPVWSPLKLEVKDSTHGKSKSSMPEMSPFEWDNEGLSPSKNSTGLASAWGASVA
jgi:Flp pilus assembly pilin Flp